MSERSNELRIVFSGEQYLIQSRNIGASTTWETVAMYKSLDRAKDELEHHKKYFEQVVYSESDGTLFG